MRAPRRLIPTERFGLSVCVGALIALLTILIGSMLPKEAFLAIIILSPFVSGFSASIVFGTGSQGGIGYTILLGIVVYLVFYSTLFALAYMLGEWAAPIIPAVYLSSVYFFFIPVLFFVPFLVSVIGALLGTLAARAVER